jgi:hypothetical protein
MAAKSDDNLKHARECKGTAACRELLKEADDALERAREQEAAETRLKKLEDGEGQAHEPGRHRALRDQGLDRRGIDQAERGDPV